MNINLAKEIVYIINLIKFNNHQAYVVGGYIRDLILGIKNYDVDITTSATPEELKKIFNGYELEENFSSLGSIKFYFDKYHIEITTFRKEYDYENHRKPNKVEFTKILQEDLIRRDFTINALCSDGHDFVDLFKGLEDIENKTIKTIGNPFVRFEEDALRILRMLRFSSKLSFIIDLDAKNSIMQNYKYLDTISFDKKHKELEGILLGENYLNVLIEYKEVLKKVFSLGDLKVELFKDNLSYEEREALFFYDSCIKINNKYLACKDLFFSIDKADLKNKLNKYGKENIYNVLYFKSKVLGVNKNEFELLLEILNNDECYNLRMLDINGNDLLNINIENNKIGKYLNLLLDAVIEEKCKNIKDELFKYLKNNILK